MCVCVIHVCGHMQTCVYHLQRYYDVCHLYQYIDKDYCMSDILGRINIMICLQRQ